MPQSFPAWYYPIDTGILQESKKEKNQNNKTETKPPPPKQKNPKLNRNKKPN